MTTSTHIVTPSVTKLFQRTFLTDEQMDARNDTQVVYVPMGDDAWAHMHGLNPNPNIEDKDEIT